MADALTLNTLDTPAPRDLGAYVYTRPNGLQQITLLIEGAHCANCISRIEKALHAMLAVRTARLNLSTGRLLVEWDGAAEQAGLLAKQVEDLGFGVRALDTHAPQDENASREKQLLRALAVAGFGAANIMLMSVAIWSGAADEVATRSLFHFLSAVIAVPVVAYAGWPFFKSAALALKARTTNMDVPISLAVLLSVGLSLVQMASAEGGAGQHVWFESATMLLFFLLIGRLLDARARGRAHSAVSRLLAMRMVDAMVLNADGTTTLTQADMVTPGILVRVPMGAQVPVDGTIKDGTSSFDTSLVTGESTAVEMTEGGKVYAGTVNLGAPITLRADATHEDTLLADITRMMTAAEQRRGGIVILADKIARAYVPVVHFLAAAAFIFWLAIMAASLPHALEITIAVLVITCPCALALAVPVVQVLASTKLMQQGILIKSPAALERLAQIDTVVFDKTGTLTLPELVPDISALDDTQKAVAHGLANVSHHPLARALAAHLEGTPAALTNIQELPGNGLSGESPDGEVKLGRAEWVGADKGTQAPSPELWLALPQQSPIRIAFKDCLRPDTTQTIQRLQEKGLNVILLSGDRAGAVASTAASCGIADWHPDMRPDAKAAFLQKLEAEDRKVMMVGDGLNDGPALANAWISVSPASGADIAQTTADIVFQRSSLKAVTDLLGIAGNARSLARQNIGFALAYNLVAIPLAMAGFITPLLAAIAMSASSLTVTANAFRLSLWRAS